VSPTSHRHADRRPPTGDRRPAPATVSGDQRG